MIVKIGSYILDDVTRIVKGEEGQLLIFQEGKEVPEIYYVDDLREIAETEQEGE